MKNCSRCFLELPLSSFNKKKSSKDGLQPYCRECNKKRSKEYYSNNLDKHKKATKERSKKNIDKVRKLVIEYLQNNPCVVCGESDIVVLDFDHLSDKSNSISRMISMGSSWKTISKEISKCQVLCANCHRRKTAKDFGWYRLTMAQ